MNHILSQHQSVYDFAAIAYVSVGVLCPSAAHELWADLSALNSKLAWNPHELWDWNTAEVSYILQPD